MSAKTQQPPATEQTIEFVKIRQWYVPRNADSYRILRELRTPLLKMHRDFLPVLKLVTVPRGIKAKAFDFESILNERLDKLGLQWKSRPGRTCKLTDKRLAFSAPCNDRNRRAIASLEASFAKFCTRWGFKATPLYSEREDRLRLVIDYQFDPSRNPIIESAPVEQTRSFELVLGNTKFKISFMDKPTSNQGGRNMPPIIHFETFAKAGSDWKLAHTGTCVDPEIGDPVQFMTALSLLFDRRQIIDEGSSYQPWANVPDRTRNEVADELRTLTTEAESLLFKLAQAPGHPETSLWLTQMWAVGRKIPRLATRLKTVHIDIGLTRQSILGHVVSARNLYPFFLQREMAYVLNLPTEVVDGKEVVRDLSPMEIDERSKVIWPRLLRIKAAWIAAAGMDTEKGASAFKLAATEPPPATSVADH